MVAVTIAEYDPEWPALFGREAGRIRAALGDRALLIEHAGSTSVPGLAAKPIIDIVLAVAGSADEQAYVPALEQAGYVFALREPGWFEHRLLRCTEPRVNLHVFTAGASEIGAMLRFRDWLRAHPEDRIAYERVKRELANRDWDTVQNYADAKTAIVTEIKERAGAS